jgi:dTDP-4-dehydrorhamnose 3,5-epimerase
VEELVELSIPGAYLMNVGEHRDNRGSFRRLIDSKWLPENFNIEQASISKNTEKGTLRGLHYQTDQSSEYKVVSVVQGSVYDVLLDLRTDSETYASWEAITLVFTDSLSLLIPPGVAHGFLTLEPDTFIFYAMTSHYDVANYSGVRWDDPKFSIGWPSNPIKISAQDQNWPLQ